MGTNFYCAYRITPEKHKTLQELLDKNMYKELIDTLMNFTKEIHIGKRSCGWQFLFESGPWECNLQSIKDFLSQPDIEIYDEYGIYFTSEEFWKEIEDCLYRDENHGNAKDYDKKYPSGYCVAPYEFTSEDGLRFSKNIDFF